MPINRNGLHWCDPASQTPDVNGAWTCPECGTDWLFGTDAGYSLWEQPSHREARLEATQAAALLAEANELSVTPADELEGS